MQIKQTIAVGGAAYLISKAIQSARVLAFADLGMEAIYEFDVVEMPVTVTVTVTVAVDSLGSSVHTTVPAEWAVPHSPTPPPRHRHFALNLTN
jgi:fumarate hydratase class I